MKVNALRIVKMSTSTYLYVSRRKDGSVLKSPIKEITDARSALGGSTTTRVALTLR